MEDMEGGSPRVRSYMRVIENRNKNVLQQLRMEDVNIEVEDYDGR